MSETSNNEKLEVYKIQGCGSVNEKCDSSVRRKREIMDSNPNDGATDANGKRASVYLGGGEQNNSG